MPKGIYKRTDKHLLPLIKRNKSLKNRKIVSNALMGHGFSKQTIKKMKKNHADFNGNNNPNWQGDNVGRIGIHIWLKKFFKKTHICEFCKEKKTKGRKTEWAKLKGKKYERKRENFIELCCPCHRKYDDNFKRSQGAKGIWD